MDNRSSNKKQTTCNGFPLYIQVTITKTGANKFHAKAVNETFGDMEWDEEMTKDGINFEMTYKGNTFKETWQRKCCVEGKTFLYTWD